MEEKIKNRFEKIEGRVEKLENFIEKGGLSKKGRLVTCHRCNKSWLCKSNALYVSCPNCGTKTKNTGTKELVECHKCKKKLLKKDATYGYNSYFCKKCFKEYDKEAKKEVDKMLTNAEKEGII